MNRCPTAVQTLCVFVAVAGIAIPVNAESIMFTTTQPGSVDGPGGTTTFFSDSDVVLFSPGTGTGTIFLDDAVINDGTIPDMNALYVRGNGNAIFSVASGSATFPFEDDMLVEYDVLSDTLSVFFDFDGLIATGSDVDIDAFHLLSDGQFLISNNSDYTLDGQAFEDGDVVIFDPVTMTAAAILEEDMFAGNDDIRVTGVSVLANGNLLISAFNEDTGGDISLGGATFGRGDLLEYDVLGDVGSVFLDVAIFNGATEDYDGLHAAIPVPASLWLLGSGLGFLALMRRRKLVG